MPITNELLKMKTMGFIQSIEKMSAYETKVYPSGAYGDDYNNLRDCVVEIHPEFERVMPPKVEFFAANGRRTVQVFFEIHTFCSQIYQLLSTFDDVD